MLTAKSLERLMELEDTLRAEYQVQLDDKSAEIDTKSAEIDAKSAEVAQSVAKLEEKQAVILKQLEQIKALSVEASANKNIEQKNRELHSRCDNLQEEISTQKKRTKSLQKDLAEERTELKTLKQFDPVKMKKNLDASKRKLAEKTTATDLLQKSLNKFKTENMELERKVKELEAKLEELEPKETEADAEDTAEETVEAAA